MIILEYIWCVADTAAVAVAGPMEGQSELLGGALEAYRSDLTLVARRALAPDLAAKVGASDLVQETFLAAGRDIAQVRDRSAAAVLRGRYRVSSDSFSPDGLTLASADVNGHISLWNMTTQSPRLVINADDEEVRALAFSPDGNTLATAGVSHAIRLWDSLTGQALLALGGSIRQINALAFSPDGGALISAEHTGLVRLHRGDPE